MSPPERWGHPTAGAGTAGAGRLQGRRILVLRPVAQAGDLAAALATEGATAVLAPAIRIVAPKEWGPIDSALRRRYDWTVFTSVNGVHTLGKRLTAAPPSGRVAAVGPATAAALRAHAIPVAFVPVTFTTVALARELPGPPGQVCLIRADIAGGELEAILAGRGFSVDRVDAYGTAVGDIQAIARALASGVDAVALTSASIASAFAGAAGRPPDLNGATLCSIGPATTAACRQAGLAVAAEANPHTIPGLVNCLVRCLEDHPGPSRATMGP